ncbi:trypsin-like serine protease [Vibrio parahaemolyticus]|nr:trypsin-like serine protease [Vibrio parahaemolyticus]
MGNFKLKAVTVVLSALSLNANAIIGGEFVSPSDYKDFTVHLGIPKSGSYYSCGGTIVAPGKVMTAAHCVSSKYVLDGPITVTQGVDRTAPTFSKAMNVTDVQMVSSPEDACEVKYFSYELYETTYKGGKYDGISDHDYEWDLFAEKEDRINDCLANIESDYDWRIREQPDVSIITFDEPLVNTDSVKLMSTGSINGPQIPVGTVATVNGWGRTELGDEPALSDRLKTIDLTMVYNHASPYYFADSELEPDATIENPCIDGEYCVLSPVSPDVYLPVNADETHARGDSGSPLLLGENTVIGLVQSSRHKGADASVMPYAAVYATFGYMEWWLAREIDSMSMPSHAEVASEGVTVVSFDVQNLTSSPVSVISDGVVEQGLDVSSNCPVTLSTFEHCEVTLTVDADQLGLVDGYEIPVEVVSGFSVLVSTDPYYVPVNKPGDGDDGDNGTDEPETTDPEQPASSKGSSGGSVGVFGLLGLLMLLRRQKR